MNRNSTITKLIRNKFNLAGVGILYTLEEILKEEKSISYNNIEDVKTLFSEELYSNITLDVIKELINQNYLKDDKQNKKLSLARTKVKSPDSGLKIKSNVDIMVEMWNNGCGALPKISILSEKRKHHVTLRIREMEKMGSFNVVFKKIMDNIKNSSWLQRTDKVWTLSFDWLIKNDTNWVKVYEGRYNLMQKAEQPNKNNVNSFWK